MDTSLDDKKGEKLWWKTTSAILGFFVVVLLFFFLKGLFSSNDLNKEYGVLSDKPGFVESYVGREPNDLERVAVVLNCKNKEDMLRWLGDIKRQRKSPNDLPVYVFVANNSLPVHKELKRTHKNFDNVKSVMLQNGSFFISDVLRNPNIDYIIEVDDSQHAGADFADYYFLGQKLLKLDKEIGCVCGGSEYMTSEYLQPSQGDVFWLMDNENCDMGMMRSRESFGNSPTKDIPICLRAEVPRVSNDPALVTKMSFNVAKMDPCLLTVEKFSKRMEHDLNNAKAMQRLDWDDLKRQDEELIYKFPWTQEDELAHYFDNSDNFADIISYKMYKEIIPLFADGRKVYIVSEKPVTIEDPVQLHFKV